ncbi:MAG: 5-formyltetrahydrofolate cyclo-ligase [Pseudorhodobacter sp.]
MTAPDKAEARKRALAARKAAHAGGQGQAADILADFLAPHRGKVLAGYIPMRNEINPTLAMTAHQGPVCVPVVEARDQPLRFRQWSPGCVMMEGDFGTRIPAEGAFMDPQVLIVPLVGFDARGFRLGYGGGYYDRTLAALRARHPVLAVGFAHAAQELPGFPIEPTDEPLDAIVTKAGLFPILPRRG